MDQTASTLIDALAAAATPEPPSLSSASTLSLGSSPVSVATSADDTGLAEHPSRCAQSASTKAADLSSAGIEPSSGGVSKPQLVGADARAAGNARSSVLLTSSRALATDLSSSPNSEDRKQLNPGRSAQQVLADMLQAEGFAVSAIGERDSARASHIIKGNRLNADRPRDSSDKGTEQHAEQIYQESPTVVLFRQLDRNGDGVITKEEFLTGLQQRPPAERRSARASHIIKGPLSSSSAWSGT